jgi:hypothetical protein
MKILTGILSLSIVLGLASAVVAEPVLFALPLDGAQEAPGPGDPDGIGSALLSIDPEASTIDWHISVENIFLPITGVHIHQAPAGEPGPIVVDFAGQLSGMGLFDVDLPAIAANPSNYYVNVHNKKFPDGAIRGQIPEPATIGLLGLGLAGLLSRRKSSRRRAVSE